MALAVILALALTPYIVAGSLAWLPGIGNALASPIAWVCALAIAARRFTTGSRFR